MNECPLYKYMQKNRFFLPCLLALLKGESATDGNKPPVSVCLSLCANLFVCYACQYSIYGSISTFRP